MPYRLILFAAVLLCWTCSPQTSQQAHPPLSENRARIEYRIGVVLVDFTPSMAWVKNPRYPDGYDKSLFDSLLFSRDYWYADREGNQIHPEGHRLWGSAADYYADQSLGAVRLSGRHGRREVINPLHCDSCTAPKWVKLPEPRCYYHTPDRKCSGVKSFSEFLDIAQDSAISQIGLDPGQYDYLLFISSGQVLPGWGGRAEGIGARRCHMSEVGLYGKKHFQHIGSYVHEIGHLLGLPHHNFLDSARYGRYWNLMGYSANGPLYEGACPAPMNPFARVEFLHYTSFDTLKQDTSLTLRYSTTAPKYYLMQPNNSIDSYVIENRLRKGYDLWTPNDPDLFYPPSEQDPNGNIGGLLIWRKRGRRVDLLAADNSAIPSAPAPAEAEMRDLAGDPFPFDQGDGRRSGLDFNDFTTPGCQNHRKQATGFAINNITWNPADSTVTVDILFDYEGER